MCYMYNNFKMPFLMLTSVCYINLQEFRNYGTVSSNGVSGTTVRTSGGGSGGTVMIESHKFINRGKVSANGGAASYFNDGYIIGWS